MQIARLVVVAQNRLIDQLDPTETRFGQHQPTLVIVGVVDQRQLESRGLVPVVVVVLVHK